MNTIFKSIESGKLVTMWPTTDHPQSSYGIPVWVDKDNWCYGQCNFWPIPFGFILILSTTQLIQFFHDRPQLSAYGFAKEAGISPRLMDYILKGERSLTERTAKKLLPVMVKYGYFI